MSHSPVAKDVILEIGKEEGLASVDVTIEVGTQWDEAWTDPCTNYSNCHPNVILNHLTDFDKANYPRKGFKMQVQEIQSFGDVQYGYSTYGNTGFYAAQGNPHYPYMAGNLGHWPPQYNMSFIFKFTEEDGTTPIEFNGLYNSLWHCCPADACNVGNRVIDGEQDTEAGRMLYLYPKSGANFLEPVSGVTRQINHALCFEIMDGGNDLLVVRGTGTEAPWEYLKTHSNSDIELDYDTFYDASKFFSQFDAYITPYVHPANWKYNDGYIEYKHNISPIHMSCIGRDATRQYSPSIENGDRFAIRSMEELFECEEFIDGNGYKCIINIAEIQDCHLEFLYGEKWHPMGCLGCTEDLVNNNGLDSDTTSLPWVWDRIRTTGTHEVCCPYTYDADMVLYNSYSPSIVGEPCNNVTTMITEYGGGGAANCGKHFYRSQNEFFRLVVTGSNPKCKITKFEIRELVPEIGSVASPVYQTTTLSVPNYDWHWLDILDRDQNLLALTFTSADLRDPSKRASGYSKTFELPASKRNQQWIETLTGVGSVRDLEKISWHRARIQANGIFVFEGFARIEQSITGQGGRYKCHILQDPTYWPELLKGLKICDLPFPTHTKNYDNVRASWTKNVNQIPYVYPVINYGAWFPGVYGATTPNQPKSLRDFHPATYVYAIVKLIFENIGYNLDSDFFESPFFKKLIMPYTSGEEYDNTGTAMGDGGDYSLAASKNQEDTDFPNLPATGWGTYTYRDFAPIMQHETDPANLHTPNTSHNSINNGYVVPFTGRYVIMYDAEVYQSQGWGDGGYWWAWITINGKILQSAGSVNYQNNPYTWGGIYYGGGNSYLPTNPPYNATSFDGYSARWKSADSDGMYMTESLGFEIDLQQGDKIQIFMKGRNSNCCYTDYSRIQKQNFHVWPHASNTAVPASTVSLGASLPCSNQLDFLKGITNMFNLHWTADESTKTVSVEPYDTFYGSGTVHDWSAKIDKTTWTDKFLIEELAMTITWKYKLDDGDLIVDRRNLSMFNAYGSPELWALEIEHGELYRKEAKDMGNKYFSPTMELIGDNGDLTFCNSSASGPYMPVMWANQMPSWGWFNNQNRPDNNTKYKPRILNYHGVHSCNNWQLTDDNGNPQTQTEYPYAYTSNYNGVNPGYDSCLAWHNHNGEQGLFDRFYASLYEKISGGAALRSCMMDLSPNDIAQVDMRDLIKIKIDGVYTYWTINKIADYKPGRDELTKVELIEWKYGDGGAPKRDSHTGEWFGGDGHGGGQGKVTSKSTGVTFINNATKEHVNNVMPNSERDRSSRDKGSMTSFVDISTAQSKNITGQQSITIGDSLKARGNQVVLGKGNKYNPTDILQVGGGYKNSKGEWIRQNAITVNDNGEVTIYGGEVVADFNIGDMTLTGDVYVYEIESEGLYDETTGGGKAATKVKKKLYLK